MAGLIPRAFIDDLLARLDIIDVINTRLPLKKKGANHGACCPFHNEKTPSFSVNQAKQFYYCFGCGASGTAISFVMEYDRLGFVEAIESLAGELGVDVPREGGNDKPREDHGALYGVLEKCANYYQNQLRDNPDAVEYLKQRGLDGETAKAFGLGYAPGGWDTLASEGMQQSPLDKAGMLAHGDSGRRYDRFRERVMFPIRDRRGRTIAFGGRIMGDGEPKYLNSPETPLFHKGNSLYGLYELHQALRHPEQIIVVEGYMDVVSLAQFEVRNTVATLGTATTTAHIDLLFRTTKDLVFCFDGDRAGRAAAWRALENALPAMRDGCEARFLLLADGEDPDSYVRAQGKAAFDALVASATPLSQFLFDHLTADRDLESIGDRAKVAEDARPLINTLPSGIYRDLMGQRLSELVGTPVKLDPPPPPPQPQRALKRKSKSGSGRMSTMRTALSMMLQFPSLLAEHDPEQIECPAADSAAPVFYKLVALITAKPSISTPSLLEQFRGEKYADALAALAAYSLPDDNEIEQDDAKALLADSLNQLRREAAATQAEQLLYGRSLGELTDDDKKLYVQLLMRSKN